MSLYHSHHYMHGSRKPSADLLCDYQSGGTHLTALSTQPASPEHEYEYVADLIGPVRPPPQPHAMTSSQPPPAPRPMTSQAAEQVRQVKPQPPKRMNQYIVGEKPPVAAKPTQRHVNASDLSQSRDRTPVMSFPPFSNAPSKNYGHSHYSQ